MIITGTLEKVSTFGMEHFLSVESAHGLFSFSLLDPDDEIDADAYAKFPMGEVVSYPVKLAFVAGYSEVGLTDHLHVSQPNPSVLTTVVIGEVKYKVDPYFYVLDVGSGDSLSVKFEDAVSLEIGSRIKVEGSLAVDQEE